MNHTMRPVSLEVHEERPDVTVWVCGCGKRGGPLEPGECFQPELEDTTKAAVDRLIEDSRPR